ncbi:hypothetical protein R3P38DRAFT_3241933 [Favolaschia claudopus]|uniref:Uncharacterized protein n=1 Tax=Favolaschia claudopus TaxID=2862362 RepID=A0AAV9Z5L3_9AGAR
MNAVPAFAVVPGMPVAYIAVPVLALPVAFLPVAAGAALPAAPPSPPAPVPTTTPKKHKETSTQDSAPKEVPPPAPGAGLPAALVSLLRSGGPYTANEVFSTVPTQPLTAIEEEAPAPEWYAILRGRFVGVVDEYLLSDFAITGVARGARKAYDTQANALRAFNKALTWGGVEIL